MAQSWYTGEEPLRRAVIQKEILSDCNRNADSDAVNVVSTGIFPGEGMRPSITVELANRHNRTGKKYAVYRVDSTGKSRRAGSVKRPVWGVVWGYRNNQNYHAVLMRAGNDDFYGYQLPELQFSIITVADGDTLVHSRWRRVASSAIHPETDYNRLHIVPTRGGYEILLGNERECRTVFYGAMIAESVIALIWATIAIAFFSGADGLAAALAEHGNNAAWVVNTVSTTTLGVVGGILAVLGVVAAPVTSGDTAFRSARLIIADVFHIEQRSIARRLMISVPLFAVGVAITFVDFDVVWRYFAWTNQALATVVLWTIAAYLYQRRANMWVVIPVAVFMTFICSSFVFVSGQFFGMENRPLAYGLAVVVTAALTVAMNYKFRRDGKLRG